MDRVTKEMDLNLCTFKSLNLLADLYSSTALKNQYAQVKEFIHYCTEKRKSQMILDFFENAHV